VSDLLALDRKSADEYLAGRGLDPSARAQVLSATHCGAPESYLVLTTRLIERRSTWLEFAQWRPRAADEPPPPHRDVSFHPIWIRCEPQGDAGTRICRAPGRSDAGSGLIEAVTWDGVAVETMRVRRGASETSSGELSPAVERAPELVLVAEPESLRAVEPVAIGGAERDEVAILLDPQRQRVLIGAPAMLRSMYVGLMYLEGRYQPHYRKVDDRAAAGERVVTWRIDWPPV
jgi:hypothetical protein